LNNFKKMLNEFSRKGVGHPSDSKLHSREEAAERWGVHPKHVVWSDRVVSKRDPVWINDLDSSSVYARENKKDLRKMSPPKE
jgi:hypothetical protein